MALFADTSALYAVLDRDDAFHEDALTFARGLRGNELVTHNYVVVETITLARSRLSTTHMRRLLGDLLPPIAVAWIDGDIHSKGVLALLSSPRHGARFVDLVSFEVMRREGIDTAFAFDRHFSTAGFRLVPEVRVGRRPALH